MNEIKKIFSWVCFVLCGVYVIGMLFAGISSGWGAFIYGIIAVILLWIGLRLRR